MKPYLKFALCLCFTGFGISNSFSQNLAKITGTVRDEKSGETLIGASIKILGTSRGCSSNMNGEYNLSGLQAGEYTLYVSYIGYEPKKIFEVILKPNELFYLNISLLPANSQNLVEVIITAKASQESINSLYAQQKNSARISDGISAESIRKSPDKNTADVLKRVSGATIQDNKFLIIRGLGDRYNSASIDNGTLPSTEPNKKAFSFDIIPANLIDNIVLSKTATPDMAGDFAGGAVQIISKDIPDKNFIAYGLGLGYNSETTFKNFEASATDIKKYLGYTTKSNLPDQFPSKNDIATGLSAQDNVKAIQSLPTDWSIHQSKALPNQNYQFSFGNVKEGSSSNQRFGSIFSLSYRNAQTRLSNVERRFHTVNFQDNTYKFATNLGALLNLAYYFNNSKISLKTLYNHILEDQFLYRTGTKIDDQASIHFYAFDLLQKSLLKTTLEGDHQLAATKTRFKWTLAYSKISNIQPDQRKISYAKNLSDINNPAIGYSANITTLGKVNARFFSDLQEHIVSGDVSLQKPISRTKSLGSVKIGLNTQYRIRRFDVRFLGLVLDNNAPDFNAIRERPLATLFANDLVEQGVYKLSEIANDADEYQANSLLNAGYFMFDQPLFPL
ncbi:MAG: TonB-dependent receptor, partial [Sphingobacteriaceae bacterium]|nr:TonB-dependent receptor [Sphingobacteriaceae bacterium]